LGFTTFVGTSKVFLSSKFFFLKIPQGISTQIYIVVGLKAQDTKAQLKGLGNGWEIRIQKL
jgi:hypothetical protein